MCARLRLEAAANSHESKTKDAYAARTLKPDNRRVGKYPKDLCNIHPKPRHSNEECFTQKRNTQASKPSEGSKQPTISTEEKARRYEAMMASSQQNSNPIRNDAKAHAAVEDVAEKDEYVTYSAFAAAVANDRDDHFLVDTGANTHLVSNSSFLHDLQPIKTVNINGLAGANGQVSASFRGTATVPGLTLDGHPCTVDIKNALYAPSAGVNLLAVSVMTKDAARFSGDDNTIRIINQTQNYVITGKGSNGLYKVSIHKATSYFSAPASVPADVWHRRYGHLNHRSLAKITPSKCRTTNCEACVLSKAHRLPFSSHLPISDTPLFRIHSDVLGPMPVVSTGGGKYIVSFIDDATRYNKVCVIKTKSQVFSHFVKFQNEAERFQGKHIKILKSDRGGEYTSNEFNNHLSEKGISFERAPAETPEQNPVSERFNRSLLERTRAILIDTGLPSHLWGEIVMTVSYLLNISPSATLDMNTPYKLWHEETPGSHSNNTNFLRAIGCAAYPLLKTDKLTKLSPKSKQCVLVGYELGARAYRLWEPESKKIIVSRNVIFHEKVFPLLSKTITLNTTNFEIDDILMIPVCPKHTPNSTSSENAISRPTEELPRQTQVIQRAFTNIGIDPDTFQRPRSVLTQQFPHHLPSPTFKSSEPPRLRRSSSFISISSTSSNHSPFSSPPLSPCIPQTTNETIPTLPQSNSTHSLWKSCCSHCKYRK